MVLGSRREAVGSTLLHVTYDTNPTHYVRRFLTATFCMPIAIAEREADDAQGGVTLFFHENNDRRGDPTARIFGVSNRHVLREDANVAYEFKGAGAPPQHVRLAGFR